ncbi:MAG: hypothetical protein OXB99_09635 [Acidimicrobiaceae bacterium]|nr:hypothetical protein [Acidimicrobiaceae bacterium]
MLTAQAEVELSITIERLRRDCGQYLDLDQVADRLTFRIDPLHRDVERYIDRGVGQSPAASPEQTTSPNW